MEVRRGSSTQGFSPMKSDEAFLLIAASVSELELGRHLPFGQGNHGFAPSRVAVTPWNWPVGPGLAGRDR